MGLPDREKSPLLSPLAWASEFPWIWEKKPGFWCDSYIFRVIYIKNNNMVLIYSFYRESQNHYMLSRQEAWVWKNHFIIKQRENVWRSRSGWCVCVCKTLVPVSRTHMTKVLAPKARCALSERFYCIYMTNSCHLLDHHEKIFPINSRYWNITKNPWKTFYPCQRNLSAKNWEEWVKRNADEFTSTGVHPRKV